MGATALWVAYKLDNKLDNVDMRAEDIAMQLMYLLRGSPTGGSHYERDMERVYRLKNPSILTSNMIKYEIELLATTGFYFPINYQALLQRTAEDIKGKFLYSLASKSFTDHFLSAPLALAKQAYQITSCLLVGSNICVMYRPQTVVTIALYAAQLRTSTGIPNPENGSSWFSLIDPSLKLNFLHTMSRKVLELLPNKNGKVKTEVPKMVIKSEPSSSRSLTPDSGIESPPCIKIKTENEDVWESKWTIY